MKKEIVKSFYVFVMLVFAASLVFGVCSEATAKPDFEPIPSGAISWKESGDHIGETKSVCGPCVGAMVFEMPAPPKPTEGTKKSEGMVLPAMGTNILVVGEMGRDAFVVMIDPGAVEKFPEPPVEYFNLKQICVTGEITRAMSPKIDVADPSKIVIVGEAEITRLGEINWDEAYPNIGALATVCGTIVYGYVDEDYPMGTSPVKLFFGDKTKDIGLTHVELLQKYPQGCFIEILKRDWPNFPGEGPPIEMYVGKEICVPGIMIRRSGSTGAAELVVDDPSEIEVK